MNEKKELSMSERISWALGQATGRQFITALVSTYILIFMTDVFGVPAAAAGVIMTAATVWDARVLSVLIHKSYIQSAVPELTDMTLNTHTVTPESEPERYEFFCQELMDFVHIKKCKIMGL